MAALDLLGRRWTLRIVWELRQAPATFRVLQERCDQVSPTSLNTRLAELRAAGIVDSTEDGYALTAAGKALLTSLAPLNDWAKRWMG